MIDKESMKPSDDQNRGGGTAEAVKLHVSGATVFHVSPFDTLPIPGRTEALSREFVEHWVVPLYMKYEWPESDPIINSLWSEMNQEVAYALLAERNWRPRCVGAFIVALRSFHGLTEDIGNLLLRSDLCYAGHAYCLALAQLNTPLARRFLHEYLDYYLTQYDLWFGQQSAMAAVAYLDRVNGTEHLEFFRARWDSFVNDKKHWNLEESCSRFSESMERINAFAAQHR